MLDLLSEYIVSIKNISTSGFFDHDTGYLKKICFLVTMDIELFVLAFSIHDKRHLYYVLAEIDPLVSIGTKDITLEAVLSQYILLNNHANMEFTRTREFRVLCCD